MTPSLIVTPKHPEHNRYGWLGKVRQVIPESPNSKETIVVEIRGKSGVVIAVLVEPAELWRPALPCNPKGATDGNEDEETRPTPSKGEAKAAVPQRDGAALDQGD